MASLLVLGLLWRVRRWWLSPAAVWLLANLAAAALLPGIVVLVAVVVLGAWWPPTRWAYSRVPLFRRLGVGGVPGKNEERTTSEAAAETARTARLESVSWGAEPPLRRWVVEPVAPWGPRPAWRWRWGLVPLVREERGFVSVVIGSGGTGKSYLLVDLAIAALTGGTWLGKDVTAVRSVLYVDAELDADTMRERSWAVARGRGLSRPPGPSRWWHLPGARLRPRGLHYLTLPVSIATPAGQALVAAKARQCKADLILFDSLTIGSAGVALADADGWNAIISAMERWGRPTICIDHTPKSGNGQVGSFMKTAKVRGALELERTADGTITVEHSKPQFGPKLPDWRVRPVFDAEAGTVRFLPLGEDGQAVGNVDNVHISNSGKAPRWGKREQAVLDAYRARGAAGATVKELAAALGLAYKPVWESVGRLERGGALLALEKVPTPGGGPAAVRYVAVGALSVEDVAVAQAEALLRSLPPPQGVPGGAGG